MNIKGRRCIAFLSLFAILGILPFKAFGAEPYTVKSGDTLWKISSSRGVGINDIKMINALDTDNIYVGQVLQLKADSHLYTVKSGDTLWSIASRHNTSINTIKALNGLSSDTIFAGQALKIKPDTITYTVRAGDALYEIASRYGTTVEEIKRLNSLKSDTIYVNQKLLVPYEASSKPSAPAKPAPVLNWPSVVYIVREGDTASSIAKKFGVSASDIMKYNYMSAEDWFNAGEKIAISGYAPRNYDIYPGKDPGPAKYGVLADWFLDGRYVLKRNAVLTITDVQTGKTFRAAVLGGFNHADVEPLTQSDTNVMKQLWPTWNWTPRPVVIYKDGMNIAASLSGMPHSQDTKPDNGVTGHFDCYLYNSTSHSASTSKAYINQHYAAVHKAAGY